MFDRAASALAAAALLTVTADPARAQHVDFDHLIAVAESQAAASQMMAKDALLVALDIDRDARLQNLEYWRGMFDRTLKGLRDGDDMLGLPAASNPAIVAQLDRAGVHWETIQSELRDGLAARDISAAQVAVIAGDSVDLLAAFEGVAAGYIEEAHRNRLTSMLSNALIETGRGTMLSQRMATEFLLIVYGHEVEANRASLGGSIAQFDTVLDNLVNGNLDERLLPPPNDEVKDQLLRARRIWEDEFRPVLRRALDAGRPSPDLAVEMVEANGLLLEQMKSVTGLYDRL